MTNDIIIMLQNIVLKYQNDIIKHISVITQKKIHKNMLIAFLY